MFLTAKAQTELMFININIMVQMHKGGILIIIMMEHFHFFRMWEITWF